MEASKITTEKRWDIYRPPEQKASFVRQISEDCERARSSFRPSEVPFPGFVGGKKRHIRNNTSQKCGKFHIPSNHEKKRCFSIFVCLFGWGFPPPLLLVKFTKIMQIGLEVGGSKRRVSKMPRALHVKSLLQNRCIPPGDLGEKWWERV